MPVDGPFDSTDLTRGADGLLRYDRLPRSLVDVLERHVRERPDREAVVELGGDRLTYRRLWDRAGRVAGGLAAAGVGPGDRLAVHMPNGAGWVLAYLGGILAGAVVVPINTRFADAEVDYVIADSGAAVVIRSEADLPEGEHLVRPAAPDTPIAVFYTSGTTGHPKGAVLTHEGVLSNCENARRFMARDVGDEDLADFRTLIAVPLFHVTGCHMQLVTSFYLGGTAVVMPAFAPGDFLDAVARERVAVSISAPAIYALIMNHPGFASADLSALRALYYGGAATTPAQIRRIKEAFPGVRIGNGFGLTESTGVLTLLPHDETEDHAESVGYPMPSNDVRIDRPDARTGAGELLARGPNIMREYWNDPQATADATTDGWLRTGDIARIDEAGRVSIVDRAKDMINRGGENVYCAEVENALALVDGVGEVAVVGVPEPTLGERVGAIVVARPGAVVEPEVLVAAVQHEIADFKVPEYVVVRSEPLPRNAAGKVQKTELRAGTWTEEHRVRRARARR